jgi:hypothetical protein
MQVDRAAVVIGERERVRQPVAKNGGEPGPGEDLPNGRDVIEPDDQVEIRMVPCGLAHQRVDTPAAVHPRDQAGVGEQRENLEDVVLMHRDPRPPPVVVTPSWRQVTLLADPVGVP